MNAIDIIRAEHNALAAVLEGLRFVARRIEAGKPADYWLLAAMIDYVSHVPEVLHHPKEDQYLFARLRQRSAEAAAVLAELEAQHRQSKLEVGLIQDALIRFHSRGASEQANFIAAVNRYVEFTGLISSWRTAASPHSPGPRSAVRTGPRWMRHSPPTATPGPGRKATSPRCLPGS